MLARFYGVYNVKIKYMKQISIVIMDNLMSQHVNEILRVYDLKGSTHKRISKKLKSNRSVRKDLNFLLDTDSLLQIPLNQREEFKKRMYKDKEFLKSCHLMDYSLLLIIFKQSSWRDEEQVPNNAQNIFTSLRNEEDVILEDPDECAEQDVVGPERVDS